MSVIPALDQLTGGKKDTTVFFRADKTVDYETMMKVMDTLHQAGYLKIGLVGEEKAAAKYKEAGESRLFYVCRFMRFYYPSARQRRLPARLHRAQRR
jgi:hypothetical protein